MKKSFLFLSSLLMPSMMCANVIFPVLISKKSWDMIILSLIIEYMCMIYLIRNQYIKVAIVTVLMNAISATIGWLAGIGIWALIDLVILPRVLLDYIQNLEVIHGMPLLGFYLIAVATNTLIEGGIAMLFFKNIPKKRLFAYVLLANTLSVIVGLATI